MELSPGLKKILEKLGINTTRLQWKLYEWEEKRKAPKEAPAQVRWMKYRHKFCPNCKGLVDRDEKTCPHCGATVPSFAAYRVMRVIGLVMPEGGAVVTFGFVMVILALFAAMIAIGGLGSIMRPADGLLDRFGAQTYYNVNLDREYWRVLAFGLIHGGLIHIGFNSIALMNVGPQLETEIGPKRMLVLITVGQLTASFAVAQFTFSGVVGASGWLFGLVGFGIAFNHRLGGSNLGLRNFFIRWAIFVLIFGFLVPGISNAGHIGGLIGGLAMGIIADKTPARRTPWTIVWEILFWPCALAWVVAFGFQMRSIISG